MSKLSQKIKKADDLSEWEVAAVAEIDQLEARVAELEAENQNLRMLHDADAAAIGQMARKALKS